MSDTGDMTVAATIKSFASASHFDNEMADYRGQSVKRLTGSGIGILGLADLSNEGLGGLVDLDSIKANLKGSGSAYYLSESEHVCQ